MKTQKAKGIMLGITKFLTPKRMKGLHKPKHYLIKSESDIHSSAYSLPAFARPCPKTPKHGFVESRKIENREQLLSLWKEVKKHDANGEIILGQSFSEVDYNAIYVSSGQLSIGIGNDGATGGKNSINFPIAPFEFTNEFKKSINVDNKSSIYIEAIKAKRYFDYESFWYLTQMRGGPEIKGAAVDYIPKTIKVKKVILPSHDLIEWEKTCKNMESGTVVYGNGYTLASHAGVHCIINRIPFITSFKPKSGETLKPVNNIKVLLNKNSFRNGVSVGIALSKDLPKEKIFYFSVSVLHNWAYLRNSEHASWLLGAASAMYAQLCSAMIFGEQRHCNKCFNNKNLSRDDVYDDVLYLTKEYVGKIPKVINCFNVHNWSDGYGGLPWATCAWHTYDLWKTINEVYNNNSERITNAQISKLIGSINNTTNLAHNNGWWFNKFVEKTDMDFLATEPGIAALTVADIYKLIKDKVSKINNSNATLVKLDKLKEPFSKDKSGKPIWCITRIKDNYSDNKVYLKYFVNGKKMEKSVKFNDSEYKKLINSANKKKISLTKNINIKVIKNQALLPGGKKVKII